VKRHAGHGPSGDGFDAGGIWQSADPAASYSVDPPVEGSLEESLLGGAATGLQPTSLDLAGTAATLDGMVGPNGATAAQVQAALDDSGLSVTGAGIKVGVLSDSFNDLGGAAADEADGALPSVTVLEDLPSGGTDEGRALLQIVHDVAPGASLYFYTAFESEQDFADGILALAAAGCKVICDDVSYYDEPFFQNGIVAQAIETVEAEGVVYVTAAGNNASDAYQNNWTPIASTSFDGVHLQDAQNFGTGSKPTAIQSITIGGNSSDTVPLLLEWNQPYGAATSDLEVVVFQDGQELGTVTNADDGEPNNPWIGVDLTGGQTYQIAIENLSGPDPGLIKEIGAGDGVPINFHIPVSISGANVGSVFGHAMTPGAITVGAVSSVDTPAFGVDPPVSESFSSSGAGTELLFSDNGTALATADQISPVTISGVDDVNTTLPGSLGDIYGTSAATPTVAATAALMLQEDPSLTPAQISQMLAESALPFGNSSVSGAGLTQIDAAVELAADAVAENPCYCRGTLIATGRGQERVENLKIGDRVLALSGAVRPIKWIGRRSYGGRFIMGRKDVLPICIKACALGDDVPKRDLWISPHHAMYFNTMYFNAMYFNAMYFNAMYFKDVHRQGVLIEAKDLVNGVTIVQAERVDKIEYFHIELESHDVILAEGALSETFIDDDSRGLFHNAHEYRVLYPGAFGEPAQYCAPRGADGYAVEAVRRRIALRAGLQSSDAGLRIGALRGYVDRIRENCMAGWAQNINHPEAPVCLDIYMGGRLIGQVLANRFREDLKRAGLGSGRHSFEFTPPEGLELISGSVEVRRSLDGSALSLSADTRRALAERSHRGIRI
jgi:hypothetical protein